jgi:polyisoprenoid-binding protein YceI
VARSETVDLATGSGLRFDLHGDVTLRGISQPVVVQAAVATP